MYIPYIIYLQIYKNNIVKDVKYPYKAVQIYEWV